MIENGTFRGVGEVPIRWYRAAPREAPRGVVLLSHGFAEHVGRYRHVMAHWVQRGFAIAGLDHRGHGQSGGPRGHCAAVGEFVADLRTLADQTAEWWPGAPRVLLGHSLGGLIGFLYLLEHPETLKAAALSAPALRVPEASPKLVQALAAAVGRLAPRTRFTARLDANALSRDPEVGPAYTRDTLVHQTATAGLFRALRRAQRQAFVEAARCFVPLLILQGDADRLVDPTAPSEIAARLTCPHELVMLPGYYHELLNEPPAERKRVLDHLDAWFERWVG